jgi:hypothetical protein
MQGWGECRNLSFGLPDTNIQPGKNKTTNDQNGAGRGIFAEASKELEVVRIICFKYRRRFFMASSLRRNPFICITYGS